VLAAAENARVAREPGAGRGRGELALRAFVYLALVVGLSNLLLVEALDRTVLAHVRDGVAYLAAAVLSLFLGDVRAAGESVFVGASAVEIVNGCTGLDVGIFLASAILVFPAPWRARVRGAALGLAIVLFVNFLRVLTLCVLNTGSGRAFEIVHVYVWPAFISLVCLAVLLAWIRTVQPDDAASNE
jgi:exosortase/archaeosortase family protein